MIWFARLSTSLKDAFTWKEGSIYIGSEVTRLCLERVPCNIPWSKGNFNMCVLCWPRFHGRPTPLPSVQSGERTATRGLASGAPRQRARRQWGRVTCVHIVGLSSSSSSKVSNGRPPFQNKPRPKKVDRWVPSLPKWSKTVCFQRFCGIYERAEGRDA